MMSWNQVSDKDSHTVHKLHHSNPQHYYLEKEQIKTYNWRDSTCLDVMMIEKALVEVIWLSHDQISSLIAWYKNFKKILMLKIGCRLPLEHQTGIRLRRSCGEGAGHTRVVQECGTPWRKPFEQSWHGLKIGDNLMGSPQQAWFMP